MLAPKRKSHEATLRKSGIDRIGDLSWGAHICLFYETAEDLLDILATYFQAGLEDGEFCICAVSGALSVDAAKDGMRKLIPGFDKYLAAGAIELIDGRDWYQGAGFDSQRITKGWQEKLDHALALGFTGMRVSGNAFWFERSEWKDFCEYEAELDRSLHGQNMLVLCTYPLNDSRAVDLLDVARTHNFSLARRHGQWEFLETPELVRARKHITDLNGAIDILSKPFPGAEALTSRERVALAQIVKGASSKEAARDLNISPRTMEFHRANIMRKLDVRNVAELIHKVLGHANAS